LIRRQSEIGDLREEDGKEVGLFGEKRWRIIVVGSVCFNKKPHPTLSKGEGFKALYF
jgi:hypothetical protein